LYLDHVLRKTSAAAPPHGYLDVHHRHHQRDVFPMKESDEALLGNLRDSHVLHHDENRDWNWELVQTILKRGAEPGRGVVYVSLLHLCMQRNQEHVVKLTVSTLDFSHDGLARVVLSKVLIAATDSGRLYATRHLRVLLRANAEFFSAWGVELLVVQLYDRHPPVLWEALDILDEACEDKEELDELAADHGGLPGVGVVRLHGDEPKLTAGHEEPQESPHKPGGKHSK
ncbi:hypothetical protein CRUP_016075, partial [Coryphaenoides rupestris]